MREILFRGKRNGEWVYGNLLIESNDTLSDYSYRIVPISMHEKVSPFDFVFPETVGQYTGLTDKNGNKIFEGDIVQCYFADGYKEKGTIRWSNQDVRFSFVTFDEKYMWGIDNTDKFEVIGNIHDNPELISQS